MLSLRYRGRKVAHAKKGDPVVRYRIREWRQFCGPFSMRQVERRTGITPSALSRIERGLQQPTPATLWKIAKLMFGTTPSELRRFPNEKDLRRLPE